MTVCSLQDICVWVCRTSVYGSILMLRMRQKSHLQGKCCAEHHERFLSVVTESCWLAVGKNLICLQCRYCPLFHCEVSHHSTSVKVQRLWGYSV